MKIRLVLLALLFITPALAQDRSPPAETRMPAAPQAAPEVEAMGARLMQEINASISCSTGMISARREIERLQAKVKELEGKKD